MYHPREENKEMEDDMNIEERDSEEPGSDEGTENRYRQVDPDLDAKVRAIRDGDYSAGNTNSTGHIAAS